MLRTLTLLLIALSAEVGLAQNPIMPEELLRAAEDRQCTQVGDFFSRPGPINPPYLYFEELPSGIPQGAAFWCRNTSTAARPYRLVIVGTPKISASCVPELNWWNYPDGLSIELAQSVELSTLKHVDAVAHKALSGKRRLSGIKSAYDGVEAVFYCVDGEWLFQIRE